MVSQKELHKDRQGSEIKTPAFDYPFCLEPSVLALAHLGILLKVLVSKTEQNKPD